MNVGYVPAVRLVRSREAWASALGWCAVVVLFGLVQRHEAAPHGLSRALDLYAGFGVPLVAYALVAVAVRHVTLARSGRPLVTLGADPARVARSTVLMAMVASGVVAGVLGAAVVVTAHQGGDPPVLTDALETVGYGALGGAAYGALFMLGAALAPAFWVRGLLLAIDWTIGTSNGFGAVLTPRGHLRNLLGGEAPFEILPWESLVGLVTLAALFSTLAVRVAARRRP